MAMGKNVRTKCRDFCLYKKTAVDLMSTAILWMQMTVNNASPITPEHVNFSATKSTNFHRKDSPIFCVPIRSELTASGFLPSEPLYCLLKKCQSHFIYLHAHDLKTSSRSFGNTDSSAASNDIASTVQFAIGVRIV